jgi:hypothetical protein
MFFESVATSTEHTYLKIELAQKTISYPPGTPFLVQDKQGNTILNLYELKLVGSFEINIPITLFVFVSWRDSPDVYTLESGTLLLETTKIHKKTQKSPPKDHFSRPSDGDYEREHEKAKNHKNVYLIKKQYFSYDEATGHDVSLEFSNGILFLYKDGKANAWKDGKSLQITNKYIIQTSEGALKLSYNPKTKKIWWIFDTTH